MTEPQTPLVTVGVSPKAIAAALTAAVAPIVVVLAARLFELDVEVDAVTGIVGPILLGLVTYLAARQASPGLVVPEPGAEPEITDATEPAPDTTYMPGGQTPAEPRRREP